MKFISRTLAFLLMGFMLAACVNDLQAATTPLTTAENIKILTHTPSEKTYVILGDIYTDHYNSFGIKRQRATIHSILQTKASEMGGDAIINVHHSHNLIAGTVIKFQNKTS